MGLGGDLLILSAIDEINLKTGRRVLISARPDLSDLLFFSILNRSKKIQCSDFLKKNKKIVLFNRPRRKNKFFHFVDKLFINLLFKFKLLDKFDRLLICFSQLVFNKKKFYLMYKDSNIFSYGMETHKNKIVWEKENNAVTAILKGFKPKLNLSVKKQKPPILNLNIIDRTKNKQLMTDYKLQKNKYIIFEPYSNKDWFGNIREWPIKNWEQFLGKVQKKYPSIKLVRLGDKEIGKNRFNNLKFIDLTNKTNINQALFLIKNAILFIGLEGGMMHMSAAIQTKSLIIWGCLTSPNFAAYPDFQRIIYNKRGCSHSEYPKKCPSNIKCIDKISVDLVFREFENTLNNFKTGICYN